MIRPGPTSVAFLCLGLLPAAGAAFSTPLLWVTALHVLLWLLLSAYQVSRCPQRVHLHVEAEPTAVLRLGRQVTLNMRVSNYHHHPIRLQVALQPPPGMRHDGAVTRLTLPPGTHAPLEFQVRFLRRGALGPCRLGLCVGDHLGWVERRLMVEPWSEVIVNPTLAAPRLVNWLISRLLRTRSTPLPGETRFAGLRPLFPEEDARRLCWSATARLGQPMTRLWEDPSPPPLVLVLDAGSTMRVAIGPAERRMDRAVSLCAGVARGMRRRGTAVGLAICDQGVRHWIAPRRDTDLPIQRALREVRCAPRPWTPQRLPEALRLAMDGPCQLVIVTEPDGDPSRLATAIQALARRASVHVLLLGDQPLAERVRWPEGAIDVYAAAAAGFLVDERMDAIQRFARASASVLDLGTCLADHQGWAK